MRPGRGPGRGLGRTGRFSAQQQAALPPRQGSEEESMFLDQGLGLGKQPLMEAVTTREASSPRTTGVRREGSGQRPPPRPPAHALPSLRPTSRKEGEGAPGTRSHSRPPGQSGARQDRTGGGGWAGLSRTSPPARPLVWKPGSHH